MPVVDADLAMDDTDEEDAVDRGRSSLSCPSDDVAGLLPAAFADNCGAIEFCIELRLVSDRDWAIEEIEEDEAPDCGRADLASPPDAVPGRLPCGSRHWNGSDPTSRRDKGDADPSF